ncbi:MAG: extracellular solute-binding protein [Promethearchaeota archaeon]
MNIKKILFSGFSIILIFSMILNPLATAVPPKPAVTEITFWYTENDTEKPGISALVAQFNGEHSDIEVTALQKGFFDAKNLYTNAFIAGAEPEVFRAARDWVPEYANSKMIQPLTDVYNSTEWDDFLPIARQMVTYPDQNGTDQIWGIPQLVDTPALMINRQKFEDAGIDTSVLNYTTSWTWDEFWGMMVKVNSTDRNVYGTVLAGMFFGGQPYFFGHGAEMFYNNTVSIDTIAINNTASRNSLTFLKNLTDSPYTPPWTEQGWTPIGTMFKDKGTVAMIAQGPWELKNYLDNSPEFNPTLPAAKDYASKDNMLIIQLPHDEDGNRGAPIGGHNYVISSYTTGDKLTAAIEFAKFMASPDTMAEAAKTYYHVPARISVMNRTDVLTADSYPYVKGYYDSVLAAVAVPVDHRWAIIEQHFADKIDEYLTGGIDLDQCISRTIALWKQDIGGTSGDGGYTEENLGIPGYSSILLLSLTAVASLLMIKSLKRRKKVLQ